MNPAPTSNTHAIATSDTIRNFRSRPETNAAPRVWLSNAFTSVRAACRAGTIPKITAAKIDIVIVKRTTAMLR